MDCYSAHHLGSEQGLAARSMQSYEIFHLRPGLHLKDVAKSRDLDTNAYVKYDDCAKCAKQLVVQHRTVRSLEQRQATHLGAVQPAIGRERVKGAYPQICDHRLINGARGTLWICFAKSRTCYLTDIQALLCPRLGGKVSTTDWQACRGVQRIMYEF